MNHEEPLSITRTPDVQQLPPGFMNPYRPSGVGFRCPFCQSGAGVIHTSKTSQAGWVMVILLLLVLCLPLFWLGFLMRENYTICRNCGMKIS